MSIILGYFGNYLYYRKVQRMIQKGFHEIPENYPTSLVCSLFRLFGIPFFAWSDYMVIKNRKTHPINTGFSKENIIKYMDIPGNRKRHIYDKIAIFLSIFAISAFIGCGFYYEYYTKKVDINKKIGAIKKNVEKTNM